MKPVERNSPNNGDCLTWDDGTPLTTSEGKAWWAGWEEGNEDGRADVEEELCDEIKRLREALHEIANLDGANIPNGAVFSIAIDIAQSALGEWSE